MFAPSLPEPKPRMRKEEGLIWGGDTMSGKKHQRRGQTPTTA